MSRFAQNDLISERGLNRTAHYHDEEIDEYRLPSTASNARCSRISPVERNKMKCLFKLLLALCLLAARAYGQADGVSPFGAADSHDVDKVDLITLTPTLNISSPANGGTVMTSQQNCYVGLNISSQKTVYCRPQAGGFFNPYIKNELIGTVGYSDMPETQCAGTGENNITYYSFDHLDSHVFPGIVAESTLCPQTLTAVSPDSSGYAISINWQGNGTLTTPDGSTATISLWRVQSPVDSFGNAMGDVTSGVYTNRFGVAQPFAAPQTTSNTSMYTKWTDTTGTLRAITSINSTPATIHLPPCGTFQLDTATVYPVSQIQYPDGVNMNITMEPGYQGTGITGRLKSFTLRTGGTISYVYSDACNDSVPQNSRTLTRTTPDGLTSYSTSITQGARTTTVLDPGLNKMVYYFENDRFLVGVDIYQNTGTVSAPVYTLVRSDTYCYQGNATNCRTTSVTIYNTIPITQKDSYHYVGSSSLAMSHETQMFDSYGNVTSFSQHDYITGQTMTTTTTYGSWNGSTCVAIGNGVNNHPCDTITSDGTHTLAENRNTYNSHGFPTQTQKWTGSQWLTSSAVPNSNGTVASATDVNGQVMTFGYAATGSGGCNGLMPTSSSTTVNGISIASSKTWNCDGGVVLTTTDANGNTPPAIQYDSMFRPVLRTDNTGYQVSASYHSNSVSVSSGYGSVAHNATTYFDNVGRPIISQLQQGPNSSNYETGTTAYAFSGPNRQVQSMSPCTQTMGLPCASVASTTLADPLGRLISSSNVVGGVLSHTYNQNDTAATVAPAPSGEHVKTIQTEVDGLDRTKSICALQTSGGTACGQAMGNSGVLTSYAYSFGSGTSTISATRGAQTHTSIVDALGRTLSSQTPERATITNVYDSYAAGVCGGHTSSPGDLMLTTYGSGDAVCFVYDGLHRLTNTGTSLTANTCKRLIYDATTNGLQAKPSDYPASGTNIIGRVVEAETDNCTVWPPTSATMITDEWFAYDADGRMTDMWEKTPHSSGFYHATVTLNPDGTISTVGGIPGYATYTFTPDGEGRPNLAAQGSTTIINGTNYDAASRPLSVLIGANAADKDTFTYDAIERMKNYTFTVGGKTMSGTAGWSSNSTLGTLNITDTFNAGGAQNCTFSYDDVARLTSSNCGTTGNWTYSYDQYDNLTKTGTTSWNPGYLSSNNHMIGSSYDGDGNLTYDGVNTYAWDGYQKFFGARPGNTAVSCGSSGSSCATYDAFGRMVETSSGGTYRELMYGPTGRLAQMNGQTTQNAYIPLPGGLALNASATGGTTRYIQHPDWLGTKRLSTSLGGRSQIFDTAYTPYGEYYDTFGTLKQDFTGDLQDVFTGLFDTPHRELGQNAARWLSPDPARASWNAYSYPTNPNSATDPSGAQAVFVWDFKFTPEWVSDYNTDVPGILPGQGKPSGSPTSSTVSAATNAYFDAIANGTITSDVTQQRNDPEPQSSVQVPSWLSDLLTHVSCFGDGVPCFLSRTDLGSNVGILYRRGRPGYAAQASYRYVVEDVSGNPVTVDSVTESLTLLQISPGGIPPSPNTWSGPDLANGNTFEDNVWTWVSANQSSYYVAMQTFFASRGGRSYNLLNQNMNIAWYDPGGAGYAQSFPFPRLP
jgi:RHS repeat-associated protein